MSGYKSAASARAICLFLTLILPCCAKVTITPLDASGKPSGEAEGLRYYLPKPYLLVMNLSGAGQQGSPPPKGPVVDPKTGKVIAAPGGGNANGGAQGNPTPTNASAAPSATGDTRLSGKPIYIGQCVGVAATPAITAARDTLGGTDPGYVAQQITRMEAAVASDPALAIGTAKELVGQN
jgi:hypothetical protein